MRYSKWANDGWWPKDGSVLVAVIKGRPAQGMAECKMFPNFSPRPIFMSRFGTYGLTIRNFNNSTLSTVDIKGARCCGYNFPAFCQDMSVSD